MALYGLYNKEVSKRVFKRTNIVPDDPMDRIEAGNPVVARVNFVRKLKLSFKEFQKLYSVRKIASLDSLDIKQKENILLAAAVEEASVIATYEDRSKIKTEEATRRSGGSASVLVNRDFKAHYMYDPETGNGVKVNTFEDHNYYTELGYTHDKPVVKRIPEESTTVTLIPKSEEDLSLKAELEQKRLNNRDSKIDKFRTKEEQRKRVDQKKNPFSTGTKFGPKKRINAPVFEVDTNTEEVVTTKDNTEIVNTQAPIEDSSTVSYTSSGGGGSSSSY